MASLTQLRGLVTTTVHCQAIRTSGGGRNLSITSAEAAVLDKHETSLRDQMLPHLNELQQLAFEPLVGAIGISPSKPELSSGPLPKWRSDQIQVRVGWAISVIAPYLSSSYLPQIEELAKSATSVEAKKYLSRAMETIQSTQ